MSASKFNLIYCSWDTDCWEQDMLKLESHFPQTPIPHLSFNGGEKLGDPLSIFFLEMNKKQKTVCHAFASFFVKTFIPAQMLAWRWRQFSCPFTYSMRGMQPTFTFYLKWLKKPLFWKNAEENIVGRANTCKNGMTFPVNFSSQTTFWGVTEHMHFLIRCFIRILRHWPKTTFHRNQWDHIICWGSRHAKRHRGCSDEPHTTWKMTTPQGRVESRAHGGGRGGCATTYKPCREKLNAFLLHWPKR